LVNADLPISVKAAKVIQFSSTTFGTIHYIKVFF